MNAPLALFVYNRPAHTRRTLEALLANELSSETELYVFADGPKQNADRKSLHQIQLTREVIKVKKGFKKVHLVERKENLGLSKSVISGITEVLSSNDSVIVLEDDILTNPGFLKYCNQALDHYKDTPQVKGISGYFYPVHLKQSSTCFFLSAVSCWGWATWKRAWMEFEADAFALSEKIVDQDKKSEFDLHNSYPYFNLLEGTKKGLADSWAIRWYASIFLNRGLYLYPPVSLTQNIGMDGTGIHFSGNDDRFLHGKWTEKSMHFNLPAEIELDLAITKKAERYLRSSGKEGIFSRQWTWMKNFLQRKKINS